MANLTDEQIQAMVDAAVEKATNLPEKAPKRVPIYHKRTGKPPETPGGTVWRVDAPEWVATGEWVTSKAEVEAVAEPKPAAKPAPVKRKPTRSRKAKSA